MKEFMKASLLILILGIVYFYLETWSRWAAGSLIGFRVAGMAQSRASMTGWSSQWMVLVGGLCGYFIGLLNEKVRRRIPLILQATIGVVLIIWPLELLSGLILNVWLQLGVWDYGNLPWNIAGQISIAYFPVFFGVSLFAMWLDDVLRHWIFDEPKPQNIIFYLKKTFTFKSLSN